MGFLGIGWLESGREREEQKETFAKLIFPYGNKQKEKIEHILKELNPKQSISTSLYDYSITKEQIIKKNITLDDKDKIFELADDIEKAYIEKKDDPIMHIVLGCLDTSIDESLNYPSIDEIKNTIDKTKN